MKILMIAWGYLPYSFSEGLCNGKLVYALESAGIDVTVISRIDTGFTYCSEWTSPWDKLKPHTILIDYPIGNPFIRTLDVLRSSIIMDGYMDGGVRWARRAYKIALNLINECSFDAILTRSPNDISHIIGYKLKQKTGIRWIANWNDPADPIWPGKYKHNYSVQKQRRLMARTEKLLRGADVNTFPSQSLCDHFIESFPFLKDSTYSIIPHIGLCMELWPQKRNTSHTSLKFLHSGNLSEERNPEILFLCLKRIVDEGFSDFQFHIMGNVNTYTTRLIEKYNLSENVKIIGNYQYLDALGKLQDYDVLILLEAHMERGIFFASKITDYLQSGLPIFAISPAKGFAADLLKNQEGEFFADNTDEQSVYNNLITIITRWKNNTLKNCVTRNLYHNVSPEVVIKLYKAII